MIEAKHYSDGTSATGTAPLPDLSPDQQAALERDRPQTTDAPHGWIWLDDDGWEHSPNPQHPQDRGEAQYGADFRPATEAEAGSVNFLRCSEVRMTLSGEHVTNVPTGAGWVEVHQLEFKEN